MRAALPNVNGIPLGNQGSKSDSTRLSSVTRPSSCFLFDLNNVRSFTPGEGGSWGKMPAWMPGSRTHWGRFSSPRPTDHRDFGDPATLSPVLQWNSGQSQAKSVLPTRSGLSGLGVPAKDHGAPF